MVKISSKVKETAARILGTAEPIFTILNSERIDLIHALNYYSTHHSYDDSKKFALEWASVEMPDMVSGLTKCHPFDITNLGFICRILENGYSDDDLENWVRRKIPEVIADNVKVKRPVDSDAPKRQYVKRVEPNTMLEQYDSAMEDIVYGKVHTPVVLTENKKHLEELVNELKNTQSEANELPDQYSNVKIVKKFIKELLDKIELFVKSVKVNRTKKTAPKKIDPNKMVSQLVLAPVDSELGCKTMRAATIIGATKLIVWHPERRTLTAYISSNDSGFLVSGRSLKNFDPEKSIVKKIRKPEEMWKAIKDLTATRTLYWLRDDCKTTAQPIKALIADGSIVLRV